MNHPTCHKGMTLIETLAALVILSLAVAAGGRWLVSFARFNASAERESGDEFVTLRAVELIRDDVFMRLQNDSGLLTNVDDSRFELVTSNRVPGDPVGWNRVRWRYNEEESTLLRQVASVRAEKPVIERVVAQEVSKWTLVLHDDESSGDGSSQIVELSVAIGKAPSRTVWVRLDDGSAR